ncbi:hypothetical protein B0H11DRAFT_1846596 [Mycena galericulata]|nr:hypothetical protein B0H11DRAFT_1846596 [Mycena galericulata]
MPDITDATDPFSPTANETNPSDVIVRSSDMVDFHAHKAILSFGSAVFKNMFSFPEPQDDQANLYRDGKPVAALPESSETMEKLLLLCYPRFPGATLLRDLRGVNAAYESAGKYQISGGQILLEQMLEDPAILEWSPHRVFAIACHRGLESLAKLAARQTLKMPRYVPYISVPEFDFISARQLRLLADFHYRCSEMVIQVVQNLVSPAHPEDLDDLQLIPDYNAVWWDESGHTGGCGPWMDDDEGILHPAPWFKDHVERVAKSSDLLPDAKAVSKAMAEIMGPTLTSISHCPKCVELAPRNLHSKAYIVKYRLNKIYTSILNGFSFVG